MLGFDSLCSLPLCSLPEAVAPPLTPQQLAELYGGNIFAKRREKKKHPPPLEIMVQLIARDEGGKASLIEALPKTVRKELPPPQLALVSDLVTRIEAASAAVHAKVRRMYEERELWLEEEEDDELLLLTFQ